MKNKIYLLAFVSLIIISLESCGGNNNGAQQFPPAQVVAYTVKEGRANYYDDYPASVVALNQVDIRPEVSGYITGIYFSDGQHVKKGMKLYAIEEQLYKASYEQAVANLNVAKANLTKAKQDAERYNQLAQNDAVAKQTLEHAQADLEAAQMQVKAAEDNVKVVMTNFKNSVIVAPFDGTIGISQVKVGSAVTPGQTLLNTISSDNPMAVDFAVNEDQIERYTALLNKKTGQKDSTFSIVLPDNSVYPYFGHLSLLDRAVNPQTGTITARLIFPNSKNLLRPGLTCNVRVLNTTSASSIIIPYKAVVVQMGEYFIFEVQHNKVAQKRIDIGRSIGSEVVVTGGLKPGDEIVTEGVQKLRDNSPIVLASGNLNSPSASSGK